MILPKLTFAKPTQITLAPPRVIEVKARTRTVTELDFGLAKWQDDPNAQTLSVLFPNLPTVQIMGTGTKTPYNPAWSDADAQSAVLAQLGITVTNGVPTVAAALQS